MSIQIIEVGGQNNAANRMQYMISDAAEVEKLPTNVAPMSTALTNSGELFVLGTDKLWHQW